MAHQTSRDHSRGFPIRGFLWSLVGILMLCLVGSAILSFTRSKAERALAKKVAELEALSLPVSLDEINRRYHEHGRDPDGNAASVYKRAFSAQVSEGLPVEELAETLLIVDLHRSIDSEQMGAIAEVVEGNQETVRLYQEAVRYPYVRFDFDFTEGAELVLPHVSLMRAGGRILAGKAIVAAESGNPEGAVEGISAIFGLAVHLSEEPEMISQLSRIAIEGFGRIALEQALARIEFSSPVLARLQSSVHAAEIAPRMIPAFEAELAKTEWYFKQIEEAGTVGDDITGPWQRTAFFFYRASGRLTRDQHVFVTRMEKVLRLVKLPHAERLRVDWDNAAKVSNESTVGEILASIIIPSMGRVVDTDTRSVTYLRAARIAIAAERYRLKHGDIPSHPNELVPAFLEEIPEDPYSTDGTFRFVMEDSIFYVRSNGTVELRRNESEAFIQFGLRTKR